MTKKPVDLGPLEPESLGLAEDQDKSEDIRVSRDFQTRDAVQRPTEWRPQGLLPEPTPQDGYTHGYKRISIRHEQDPRNVASFRSEGWEPVLKEEQPQMFIVQHDRTEYRDFIVIGGLMLCKIPTTFIAQRDAYIERTTKSQINAVDNTLFRNEDKRMPMFSNRQSTVSLGSGRPS